MAAIIENLSRSWNARVRKQRYPSRLRGSAPPSTRVLIAGPRGNIRATELFSLVLGLCAAFAPALSAANDLRSEEIEIQRMADEWKTDLSESQIAAFKVVSGRSDLFSESKLEEETINALGSLIERCGNDPSYQDDLLGGRDVSLRERIGIDVDPRGYALLKDMISRQHNRTEYFGSMKRQGMTRTDPEWTRLIQRARRYIGIYEVAGDPTNSKPFASVPIPLAMRHPRYPTLPAVRRELMELLELDQKFRNPANEKLDEKAEKATDEKMNAADKIVVARFRKIFNKYGVPDNEQVGRSGTLAAWLIVHHAMSSPDLVRKASVDIRKLYLNGDLPDNPYALFVDRAACLVEHKEQTYGTFPVGNPSTSYSCPIADPANLNARRASVLLEPMQEPGSAATQ